MGAKLSFQDLCPHCKSTIQSMLADTWSGKPEDKTRFLLNPIMGNISVIACTKCGGLFVPMSLMKDVIEDSRPRQVVTAAPSMLHQPGKKVTLA